jgi:hypothetical protein
MPETAPGRLGGREYADWTGGRTNVRNLRKESA